MKKKKVIIIVSLIILVIIIVIISAILIIKKANNKETNLPDENNQNVEIFSNERITKQEEVTDTIKEIVDSINSLNTYAKNNQKSTFTIRELQDIFQADITKFKESRILSSWIITSLRSFVNALCTYHNLGSAPLVLKYTLSSSTSSYLDRGSSSCSIFPNFQLHQNALFCGGDGTDTAPIILGWGNCTN